LSFKSLFLPVGLVLSIILGTLIPEVGTRVGDASLGGWSLKDAALVVVFLVTGLGLSLREFHPSGALLRAIIACLAINLVMGPVLGLLAVWALPLSRGAVVGLLTMLCVPVTLSSATVIVRNAGGNTAWSVLMTLALTMFGTLVLPISLGLTLGAAGDVKLDMMSLLTSLAILVGAPLAVGMFIRSRTGALKSLWLDYAPSSCVLLVVFLSVCANVTAIRSLSLGGLAVYTAVSVGIHLALLLAGAVAGKRMRFAWRERLALALACSQKTLPLALTALVAMEASLNGSGEMGLAVVVCVIFHLQQILVDSALAPWLAKRWSRAAHS
jgi:predicted Na+-dependent transporter